MSDTDRIAVLESQVARLIGQEQTLHPHGNRTNDRRGSNPVELLNENIGRLFAKVNALQCRLTLSLMQEHGLACKQEEENDAGLLFCRGKMKSLTL